MESIEQMIKRLCPEGVEYVKLGEVCEIKGRIGFRGYTRQDLVAKGEGAISLSPSNIVNEQVSYENCTYLSWAKYEESPEIMAEVGDVLFTKTASVGKTAIIKNLPEKATINPQLVLLKNIKCDHDYLSYALKGIRFQAEVAKRVGIGSVPNISQSSLSNIEIPLPPMEIQARIVEILDKMTTLKAELEAELEARKQQYEYYRNKLFKFKEGECEWKKLGEIAMFQYGFTAKAGNEGAVRLIRITDIDEQGNLNPNQGKFIPMTQNLDAYLLKQGDIVMARTGATYGKTLYFNEDYPSVFASFLIKIIPDKTLNTRYYWHFSKSSIYWQQAKRLVGGGAQPQFNTGAISQILIPIPSMEEQSRIVSILDRFEALTTDLQSGLPAEIEARRQQYEHYRNKLLTFERR